MDTTVLMFLLVVWIAVNVVVVGFVMVAMRGHESRSIRRSRPRHFS